MLFRFTTLAVALCATAGNAASLSRTLDGNALSIDSPCAQHVEVAPDPALHGQTVLTATAEHQEEIDHLLLESAEKVHVRTQEGDCWRTAPTMKPTLVVTLRVPTGFPIGIEEADAGQYVIGATGGPLSLDLSGAAHVTAAKVAALDVDLNGYGSVEVTDAVGSAEIALSGEGHVTIAHAIMPGLTGDLSGAGTLTVSAGHIDRATLEVSGMGAMKIGAVVDNATVDISGAGAVHFTKVTGNLTKEVSGVGDVTVGN